MKLKHDEQHNRKGSDKSWRIGWEDCHNKRHWFSMLRKMVGYVEVRCTGIWTAVNSLLCLGRLRTDWKDSRVSTTKLQKHTDISENHRYITCVNCFVADMLKLYLYQQQCGEGVARFRHKNYLVKIIFWLRVSMFGGTKATGKAGTGDWNTPRFGGKNATWKRHNVLAKKHPGLVAQMLLGNASICQRETPRFSS